MSEGVLSSTERMCRPNVFQFCQLILRLRAEGKFVISHGELAMSKLMIKLCGVPFPYNSGYGIKVSY